MSAQNKDSPEAVEFMALYRRLKDWCDDDPEELAGFAESDSSVRELCTRLNLRAGLLRRDERRGRQLFTAPVDPKFILAWRDFEDRYQFILSKVWLSQVWPEALSDKPSYVPRIDLQWDNADDDAREQANAILWAIEFAQEQIGQDHRWGDQPDFVVGIQDGIDAWARMTEETGFDLRGVFRRRELVPFVLVPRQVSNKQGSADKLSMLRNLQQAHDAFVFGASFAALALMRSVMEVALRDHYGAAGKSLEQLIRSAKSRLPRGASAQRLHRLQDLANAILHIDRDRDQGLLDMDEARLEKEIASLLLVLRALIEGPIEFNALKF